MQKERQKNQKKPVRKGTKKNGGRNNKKNVEDTEFKDHTSYQQLNTQELINLTLNLDQENIIISNEEFEDIENCFEKSSGVNEDNFDPITPISKRLRTRPKAKKHQC